ncbi:Xaa-Pro aminopeptidase [Bradyrhizobium elkanii]|nr:Xaa-Pro aminopeptidase [Bradyrhizobium elkanii]
MTIGKAPQAFPRAEYLRRLAAVKAEMARRDIDGLIITSAANIGYLTGNRTRLFALHALVVSMSKEEPTLVVRGMDAAGCFHQAFLVRSNVIGYSESFIGKPDTNGYDAVIDFLHEAGLANRSLGLEHALLSAHAIEKFKGRLPNASIVDCSRVVDWIRIVKSDLEIALMREAASIADAAVMRAAEVIRPGVREAFAASQIISAQVCGGADGYEATAVQPLLMCSTPRTGTPHIMWSDDVFRQGSQVNIEVSGNRYGYVAPLMRTYSIGAPSDRLRRIHEAEIAGMEVAMDAARPGRTCSDVANAFYRTSEKHGFKKESRCGYSIGVEWLEPTASLADGDMTQLKENMTFHLMLGNWIDDDFGYTISESIRVTKSGAEALTKAPRILFEI